MNSVYEQINKALDKIASGAPVHERFRAILQRYAAGEIDIDEAYYDLLEEELIPMPQRCAMTAKLSPTPEDELHLKEKIKKVLF